MWMLRVVSLIIAWYVVWLQVLWFVYEICGLITWYVSCCAKCHFHPFLPFSSITKPRYCKMLPVQKTPVNSTLQAYRLVLPGYDTIRSHFRHYRTKNRKCQIRIDGSKIWYVARYTLHILHFLVNNHLPISKHNLPHYSKYHLLNYPYYINYSITYPLQLYRYYNTVIIL